MLLCIIIVGKHLLKLLFSLRNKAPWAKAPLWHSRLEDGKKIQYFPLIKPEFSYSEMPGKWIMKPESFWKGYLNNSRMFGILAAKFLFHQNFCHGSPHLLRNTEYLKPHESRLEFQCRTLSSRKQMKQQQIFTILCQRKGISWSRVPLCSSYTQINALFLLNEEL